MRTWLEIHAGKTREWQARPKYPPTLTGSGAVLHSFFFPNLFLKSEIKKDLKKQKEVKKTENSVAKKEINNTIKVDSKDTKSSEYFLGM